MYEEREDDGSEAAMAGGTGGSTYERGVLFGYLRLSPIFSKCTDEQLEQVEASGNFVQYQPGAPIVRQGDPGEEFFVIMSGKASVVREGKEVGVLGQGDYFGELALFDPAPRNATVTVGVAVAAVVIRRDAFERLLGDAPGIRAEVLRGMAHRLHELDAKV